MADRWWFLIVVLMMLGCARGTRPKYTIEAAKKELQELEVARKKEWTPPDQ